MDRVAIKFKTQEFEKAAKRFGGCIDQVPFALAGALNDSAEAARKVIIEDLWPSKVQARNPTFMRAALTTKGNRATKKQLRVAITESDAIGGRASLKLHADGGLRKPTGNRLAIPTKDLQGRRNAKGVPKSMRPTNIANSFKKDDVIYQRTGKYIKVGAKGNKRGKKAKDTRKITPVYYLRPQASIKKDVPFRETFVEVMNKEIRKNFAKRFEQAMKTRK